MEKSSGGIFEGRFLSGLAFSEAKSLKIAGWLAGSSVEEPFTTCEAGIIRDDPIFLGDTGPYS
jgi:hypothetical protein